MPPLTLYDVALIGMESKRNLALIPLALLLVSGCAQHQPAVVSDSDTGAAVSNAAEQLPTISVEALKERIDSSGADIFILDVRSLVEYNGLLGHIEGAYHIPIQELDERLDELMDVKRQPIYVVCHSGGRSARATRMLLDAGFQAINVAGGMMAWYYLMEDLAESNEGPD